MSHARALPWILLAGIGLLLWAMLARERAHGADRAALTAARARSDTLTRRLDSLERIGRPQTATAVRLLTRYDSTGIRQLLARLDSARRAQPTVAPPETIPVPVRVLVVADSAIAACSIALTTCEQRVAAARAVTDAVRAENVLLTRLGRRDWTAAGLAWDPHTQRLGAFVDRDLGRLRLGARATPADEGLRLELRVGVRW